MIQQETCVYKQVGDVELALHLFLPDGHTNGDCRPAIVFFFGGGWLGGDPKQFFPQCNHLAQRGMVAISAAYRVEKTHGTSPQACVRDGKSAIRWVRQHAGAWGIDPTRIAAGGGSAGGHVAAAVATTRGFEEDGEDRSVSCRPDALVLFNPVFDNGPDGYGHERVKRYWQDISPLHTIGPDTPPTLVLLGSEDHHVPVRTAEAYKQKMEAVGCRCDLQIYPGQKHGFFNYANRTQYDQTVAAMDTFLVSLGYLDAAPGFYTPAQDREQVVVPPESLEAALPWVLLLGDSISQGYTPLVREALRGVCNVDRPRANCGDTRAGLAHLAEWVGRRHWDLIHFNWGLHDLCYRHPESKLYGHRDKVRGTISVPLAEYRHNLEMLVQALQRHSRKLVWASTTVVPPGEGGRFEGDAERYNAVAAEIMQTHGIPINDLHACTAAFAPDRFTCPGDVHFNEAGTRQLADQVVTTIRKLVVAGDGETGPTCRQKGSAWKSQTSY